VTDNAPAYNIANAWGETVARVSSSVKMVSRSSNSVARAEADKGRMERSIVSKVEATAVLVTSDTSH